MSGGKPKVMSSMSKAICKNWYIFQFSAATCKCTQFRLAKFSISFAFFLEIVKVHMNLHTLNS